MRKKALKPPLKKLLLELLKELVPIAARRIKTRRKKNRGKRNRRCG